MPQDTAATYSCSRPTAACWRADDPAPPCDRLDASPQAQGHQGRYVDLLFRNRHRDSRPTKGYPPVPGGRRDR